MPHTPTPDASCLSRRSVLAGGLVLLAAPAGAEAQAGPTLASFGADPTGRQPCDEAFDRWIAAALAGGGTATLGAGRFTLASTRAIALVGQTLRIVGAGAGRSIICRMAGTVTANGQPMIQINGANGARLTIEGLTVDMACDAQPRPPGNAALPFNFAREHCACVDMLPRSGHGFASISISDCEVRDPVADGFAIRGMPSLSEPGVDSATFLRVANTRWPVDQQRPRVRGDITITAWISTVSIQNCTLPRLHYEIESELVGSRVMLVNEANNQVGELIATWSAKDGDAGSTTAWRRVTGGRIAWRLMQGRCRTDYSGTLIEMRAFGSRLLSGVHRFSNCRFVVSQSLTMPSQRETGLLQSVPPVADLIVIDGGSLSVPANVTAPHFFLLRSGNQTSAGVISIRNFAMNAPAMQLALVQNARLTVDGVTSDYNGSGVFGGAFVSITVPTMPGNCDVALTGITLTNPRATLVRGPVSPRQPGTEMIRLTTGRNRLASGRAIDSRSPDGEAAMRQSGAGGSWVVATP